MRQRKTTILLLIAMLVAVCGRAGAEMPFTADPARIEAAAASVVYLETYDRSGVKISSASGFVAFEPPVLVTAWHAAVNMAYMRVRRDDGTEFRVDRLLDGDEAADIVLCALPEDAGVEPLPVCADPPLRGEDMLVISTQAGVSNLVTKGNVCGRWDAQGISWLLFSAPVSAGSSGGPVFNSRGEVIGLVMGTYDRITGISLAAPIGKAEALTR